MKKLIIIALAAVTALGCLLALAGCNVNEDKLPEFESGYFRYAVRTEKDGAKKAYLVGLTETGLEQTELIYPKELDGIEVYGIGYKRKIFQGHREEGTFNSAKLEKFYLPHIIREASYKSSLPNCNTFIWVYAETLGINKVRSNGACFGYNYLKEGLWYKNYLTRKIANVSYLYNYENDTNGGTYWVDSYNESVIDFIPPEPTREGYNFGGWYKEKECINYWDFTKDKTGKEIKLDIFKENQEYEGINLYAKWIKIENKNTL